MYHQATSNCPVSRLHNRSTGNSDANFAGPPVLAAEIRSQARHAFVDAGAHDGVLTKWMRCLVYRDVTQACVFQTLRSLPSLLVDVTAVRNGLQALTPALVQAPDVLLYEYMRDLRHQSQIHAAPARTRLFEHISTLY